MPGDAFPGDADGDGEHLQHDAGPTEGEDEGIQAIILTLFYFKDLSK